MLTRSINNISVGTSASPRRLTARPIARPVPARTIPRSRQVVCQGLFGLGLPELAVIAGVTALIFGPSKLPELGKSLGKTVKSFQTAASEFNDELKAGMADDQKKADDLKKASAEEPKKPEN